MFVSFTTPELRTFPTAYTHIRSVFVKFVFYMIKTDTLLTHAQVVNKTGIML